MGMTADLLSSALQRAQDRTLNVMELLSAAGQLAAAGDGQGQIALYDAWLTHNADNPLAYAMYFNFGVVLSNAGKLAQAKEALNAAIRLNPDFMPAYINLGTLLEKMGAAGEGVQKWYEVANKLHAVNGEAIHHKTTALKQIGRLLEKHFIDENAEEALKHGLDINPTQTDVVQHWVSLRTRQCKWPVIAPWGYVTREHLLRGISALSLAAYTDDPLMQLGNAANYNRTTIGRPKASFAHTHKRLLVNPHPSRRRVGYLSSDLREHAVGFLTSELYEAHNRGNVELFVYYCGHQVKDATQDRIKAASEHWLDISGLSDEQAAERIVADGVEILVDLNGYTQGARTKMLAMRPAPIIVNWLGFPGTLASPYHHYLIADEFIVPPDSELYYTEKIVRIPCYQPNDRKREVATHRPTRQEAGLPEGATVFCCFNGVHKISPFTWRRWITILQRTPNSVLWLLGAIESTNARLKKAMADAGVDPERLIIAPKARNPEHLARYPLADLFLDTAPYGAHTTCSDALWMGVPVLTLAGRGFAARVCGSLVRAAGLSDLVVDTPEAYVELAVALGSNPAKLREYRTQLEKTRDTCVLFDTDLLCAGLEQRYAEMWQDYLAGRLPRPDLTNVDVYNEIGIELDKDDVEMMTVADYHQLYRDKLAERHAFSPLPRDSRLWTDPK
jgi:predicted O-linked N-acetylglucosamine transferase (SPINDLY family)